MKGYAALAAAMASHQAEMLFGVMGDGNMFFIDSFVRDQGGRYVAAAHEAGAVLMATGYANASGRVGVATVTHGPGLANTLGALVSAQRDRRPVVLIAGDTAAAARGNVQKIDQASLVLPTGAGFERAYTAKSAAADLARAMRRAEVEQRPIVLNVPVDQNFAEVDVASSPLPWPVPSRAVAPDPDLLDRAVGILAAARRPLILAGAGVVQANAVDKVRSLAEHLGAPLTTTLAVKDMFGHDAHDLGVFGTLSPPRAVQAILAADCILAVGASLNHYTGGGPDWPFLADKAVVHCDLDPDAISGYPSDAAVLADAGIFADTVVEWLQAADHTPSAFRDSAAAMAGADEPRGVESTEGSVDLAAALAELDHLLPAERSMTVDGGRFTAEVVRRLTVTGPRAWTCTFGGFGAIGNALATAVGVGFARPDRVSVALVGDGCFMLGGLTEFSTAVRHGADLVVIVCNDGSYGAEYRKLQDRDLPVETSLFAWPDLAPVAEALGGTGCTVRNLDDLTAAAKKIAARERPVLLDLKLDPASVRWDH